MLLKQALGMLCPSTAMTESCHGLKCMAWRTTYSEYPTKPCERCHGTGKVDEIGVDQTDNVCWDCEGEGTVANINVEPKVSGFCQKYHQCELTEWVNVHIKKS